MTSTISIDPVGATEIALYAGVNRATVEQWTRRHPSFPRPRWTVGGRPAWDWCDVYRWLRETGRYPNQAAMVARASQVLDEHRPGWHTEVDVDELGTRPGWTILDHVYGYGSGMDELGLRDDIHAAAAGFAPADRSPEGWRAYWTAWRARVQLSPAVVSDSVDGVYVYNETPDTCPPITPDHDRRNWCWRHRACGYVARHIYAWRSTAERDYAEHVAKCAAREQA